MDTPRPSPRTNRTRRVPHPVLIGHAASLLQEATGAPDAAVYSGAALAALDAARLRRVEADCYHCLTKMLDLAQVGPRVIRPPTPHTLTSQE